MAGCTHNCSTCSSKIEGCSTCSAIDACLSCVMGYYYDSTDYLCKPCDSTCKNNECDIMTDNVSKTYAAVSFF